MASIWKRNDHAYLIQWREVDGKQKSKQFQSKAEAEKFKLAVENRLRMERADPDPFGWNTPTNMVAEDARMSVAGYARGMVRADLDLRSTTRELYERTIKHHLDATVLGKMDIRYVKAADLSGWWAALKDTNTGKAAGPGVRRNARSCWRARSTGPSSSATSRSPRSSGHRRSDARRHVGATTC
jgi:hypothetical protein